MREFSRILEYRPKKKVSILINARISTNSGVKPKKNLHLKKCANMHEFWGEKLGPYCKIWEKTVFGLEFWGDKQFLGGLRHRNALQWHRACYFLWVTILALGSTILVWGSTSSELGGHGPGMPPVGQGLPWPRIFFDALASDVVKTPMVETKAKTWKKFETKTWDQDLKKFSRPRSRLGEFIRDRDETSRPEILEAKLIRIDYWQPFSWFFLKQTVE